MLVALPVISFLCASLLTIVFLPVRRIYTNTANVAFVLWLIFGNLIHGINSLVWAGNVDIHIPEWGDIVTKLLLGANVALPAACLAMALQLELVSSKRPILTDLHSRRARTLLDIMLCYLSPLIYMSLHFIGQDHRFNIVKDYGPFAAINPSTPALIIIWIPPLMLCIAAIFCSGLAIHHSFRHSSTRFTTHLESRCSMTSSLFVRRLATIMMTTTVILVVNVFSLFSPPDIIPWTSWSEVHAHFYEIKVVTEPDELTAMRLMWWGIPVATLVYIFLSLIVGEEVRDSAKYLGKSFSKFRKWMATPSTILTLPTHRARPQTTSTTSRATSVASPEPRGQMIELKSGWDEMLDDKTPRRNRSLTKSLRSPSSPTPSTASATTEDHAFMSSTISYLKSPTAQTLGLLSPLASPPPIYTSPRKAAHDELPWKPLNIPTAPVRSLSTPPRFPQSVPEDASSTISSIMNAPWPLPPASLPSPVRSRSQSPSASSDTFTYPLRRSITPPPFEGPGVSTVSSEAAAPLHTKRVGVAKRPSVRSLRRTWSRDGLYTSANSPGEVIYMTVVKETV